MATLDEASIEAGLARLPQWHREGEAIVRTVRAEDFLAGVHLVTAVAYAAEQADHHPDIDIRYTTVRFRLSSHDVGGVTQRDFSLAEQIDALVTESARSED